VTTLTSIHYMITVLHAIFMLHHCTMARDLLVDIASVHV
jgi:hypothetical protein